MTRPMFTIANKGYLQPEFQEKYDAFITALRNLFDIIPPNAPGSHMFAADDMICWFRTLGFLDDPKFIKATEGFEGSRVMRGKLWRVYLYCWAVESASRTFLRGSFLDLGTYDGKTVQIADRYCPGQTWLLFDTFDHHPTEKTKQKHSEDLIEEVKSRIPGASVIKGYIPQSIPDDWRTKVISFLHLDLNDARAERQALVKLYDRVTQGGVILLDDYGWLRYKKSYEGHKRFFERRGQVVLELPTGQGLVIKR